jgi:hypothetical protein
MLKSNFANKGSEVSLNPQPLPPKEGRLKAKISRKGDESSLNPQPLPPKESGASR